MKETKTQVALSTRLDRDTYNNMKQLLEITGKSVAVFTSDAVNQYIHNIKDPKSGPTDALKIDQYAWSLKHKRKE